MSKPSTLGTEPTSSDRSHADEPGAVDRAASAEETGRRIPPAALFWLAVLLVFVGGMVFYAASKRGREPRVNGGSEAVEDWSDAPILTRFRLTERSGRHVSSEDLLGKVWVTNFFYSSCPGSCRQQTQLVQSLQRQYGRDGVVFVSITCDPAIDTPERLREYAHNFDAPDDGWLFLTGEMIYLRRVGAEFFRLAVMEKEHQDNLAVVDKWGNVRGRFNWHDPLQLDRLKSLLPELLAETEAPAEIVDANPPPPPPPRPRDDEEDEEEDDMEAAAQPNPSQEVDPVDGVPPATAPPAEVPPTVPEGNAAA